VAVDVGQLVRVEGADLAEVSLPFLFSRVQRTS
jgi:hypothetical protein